MITEITPKLFLSDYHNACNLDKLKELGIRNILCLDEKCLSPFRPRSVINLKDAMQGHSVNEDAKIIGTVEVLDELVRFNSPVLVHCAMGMNRSAGIVAAWLVRYHSVKSIGDAIRSIENKGHETMVHKTFRSQLERLYNHRQ